MLKKDRFNEKFAEAIKRAFYEVCNAKSNSMPLPEKFRVHAPNAPNELIDRDSASALIFINESLFYKIIDVGIILDKHEGNSVFVRVSGHDPVEYENTFDPSNLGPFKIII